MAYDYDVDILAAYWTGAEALKEPYASFIAANPTLTDEVSENRILSTIELLRSHMEMLQNREEAKLLHESISKLFRHTAGGSNPWSEAAAVTGATGNVITPNFPAGASVDITLDGATTAATSASGGDIDTVVAELNVTLDAGAVPATPEITDVVAAADVGGSLSGKYFNLAAGVDSTLYHVWMNTAGIGESISLDFTGVTGATLPTGVVPAAWFDVTVPGGVTYRFWFGDFSTTPPAVTTEILKPIPFGGAETDQQISDLAIIQILAADAELAGATNGGGTTPAITCTMASVGNVTDPVDGAVSTGAIIGTTTQGVSASVDPAPGGTTGLPVPYAVNDTDAAIGGAIATAVGGNADFSASGTTTVTITTAATGVTTDASDGDTGFGISVTQQGSAGSAGGIDIQAYKTADMQLGFRAQADFLTFAISNGAGGIIGPAGIIPGTYLSTPARVADQGRTLSLNHFAGTRRNPNLTS